MSRSRARCHPARPATGRGLCTMCYQRWKKGDSAELNEVVAAFLAMKEARTTRRIWEREERNLAKVASRSLAERRERGLMGRYGMTLADYDFMLASQGGVCAVRGCGGGPGSRGVFFVDHCHTTGTIRGLLCPRCNGHMAVIDLGAERLSALTEYGHSDRVSSLWPFVALGPPSKDNWAKAAEAA